MKYKFLLNSNYCFSKLVTTFLHIINNFLSGQSVVTDIVRDWKEDIFSIEYYGIVSKNLELLKLESFHPNGHIACLELFSSGIKNGVHKEFFNNGNKKSEGIVSYTGQKEQRCWDTYENIQNCNKDS